MTKSKTEKLFNSEKALNKEVSLERICQKPNSKETEITNNLINSGLPIMSQRDLQLGTVKYDTPHLSKHNKSNTFMVTLLPRAIQNEFQSLFEKKFPQYAGDGNGVVNFKGRMYPENIFFNKIEKLESIFQFPDILITSDINSLYHNPNGLLNSQNFETFKYSTNEVFTEIRLENSHNVFRYLAADALVMVVNKYKFRYSPMPVEWYELLNPMLKNKIVFPVSVDYHCNTVYLNFVRDFGIRVIDQLINNTLTRLHPDEMLDQINAKNPLNAAIYIMSYSYARHIKTNIDFQIIWPEDGAILLPIQMLVKKGAYNKYKDIIRFITGSEMGKMFAKNGLIPANPNCNIPSNKLNWLGWEFLNETNMDELKKEMNNLLNPIQNQKAYEQKMNY